MHGYARANQEITVVEYRLVSQVLSDLGYSDPSLLVAAIAKKQQQSELNTKDQ